MMRIGRSTRTGKSGAPPAIESPGAKAARHHLICELLSRNEVRSQQEILALLEADRIVITQTTLSRDLREIGARKRQGVYQVAAEVADPGVRRELLKSIRGRVQAVERGGTLVILRTLTGHAPAVAIELERSALHEVLGTIAGTDTVFIATSTSSHARQLAAFLTTSAGPI